MKLTNAKLTRYVGSRGKDLSRHMALEKYVFPSQIVHNEYRIPAQIFEDDRLDASAVRLWGYIAKLQANGEDVSNAILANLSKYTIRGVIKIKAQLASCGYLKKIERLNGQVFYTPAYNAEEIYSKVDDLLAVSHVFKTVPAQTIAWLKKKHEPHYFFDVLEALESTYEDKPEEVKNPVAMLKDILKRGGVTLRKGYKTEWWRDREKVRRQVSKARKEVEASEKELEKQRLRQEELEKRLDSLSEEEKAALKERAIESLKQAGQWPLPFASEIGIRLMMRKMVEKEA